MPSSPKRTGTSCRSINRSTSLSFTAFAPAAAEQAISAATRINGATRMECLFPVNRSVCGRPSTNWGGNKMFQAALRRKKKPRISPGQ
jgi:hypothetical protein